MRVYQNLFVTERTAQKAEQILEAIKLNKITPNIYVIVYPSNPVNQLDIIPSWQLLQPGYSTKELVIVGLASGKKDAFQLVEHILKETYEKTGGADMKEYLQCNEEGQV